MSLPMSTLSGAEALSATGWQAGASLPAASVKLEAVAGGLYRPTVTITTASTTPEALDALVNAAITALAEIAARVPTEIGKAGLVLDGAVMSLPAVAPLSPPAHDTQIQPARASVPIAARDNSPEIAASESQIESEGAAS